MWYALAFLNSLSLDLSIPAFIYIYIYNTNRVNHDFCLHIFVIGLLIKDSLSHSRDWQGGQLKFCVYKFG